MLFFQARASFDERRKILTKYTSVNVFCRMFELDQRSRAQELTLQAVMLCFSRVRSDDTPTYVAISAAMPTQSIPQGTTTSECRMSSITLALSRSWGGWLGGDREEFPFACA